MHFRAKSFPVILCFTRKTSEKAPLRRRCQDIRISTGWLEDVAGSKTEGSMREDVAGKHIVIVGD